MSPFRWFLIAIVCIVPLHVTAIALDEWFTRPPKPGGDGPDYEAIAFDVSRSNGWSHSYSDQEWRKPYLEAQTDPNSSSSLDYAVQFARNTPTAPDTNRPPLFPTLIGGLYCLVPRGPTAFALVRIGQALCLACGCAIAVGWSVAIASRIESTGSRWLGTLVAIAAIAIVFSERNLRNYATDFLTEPLALLLTQGFLVAVWCALHHPYRRWAIVSALLFAGMYFCRAVFLLWLPLVVIWLSALMRFSASQRIDKAPGMSWYAWVGLFSGLVLCLSMPWWVRNCVVLQSWSPLGTKGSVTLLGGYCDSSLERGGEWQGNPERELRHELESSTPNQNDAKSVIELEKQLSLAASRNVWSWASAHYSSLPLLFLKRVVTEWNPYQGKALVLKLLAIVGSWWLWRRSPIAFYCLTVPLAINTFWVMCLYSVGGRFLVPTYGELYILSAFGIAGPISDYLGRGSSKTVRTATT